MKISKIHNHLKESRHIASTTATQPFGLNTNPQGLPGIRIDKNRKFAITPKEYVALIKECMESMLLKKGFDKQRFKLIMTFTDKIITEKNYLAYINLPAIGIYQKIENEILVRL